MSFFIRTQPKKQLNKRSKVNGEYSAKKRPRKKETEEIDSDEVSDNSKSDVESDIGETAQEKKIRLAKIYLEEIEKRERERVEENEVNKDVITSRLQEEIREKSDKYRRTVASKYKGFLKDNVKVLKCKEHSLSLTCVVVSQDGRSMFTASKDGGLVKWSLPEGNKLKSLKGGKEAPHGSRKPTILCLALSSDEKFLVSGGVNKVINVWSPDTFKLLNSFSKHSGPVTGLAFRKGTHQLFSASDDKTVKIWNLDEMSYIETLFGHQTGITSIDALSADRAITSGGGDNTIRIWKVVEESQLIFNGHRGSIECVKLITEDHFLSCGTDGDLCLWGSMKKKPLCSISLSHGVSENSEPNWISSTAAYVNSDLVASGSCNGAVKLWKCGDSFRSLEHLFDIPVVGFVNSLAFAPDGSYLIAGVGQEHRLGRWWRNKDAKNVVLIIPLLICTE